MTYRFVVYDIEKSLKQSFDDANITFTQILYWVQVVANNLRAENYLQKKEDAYISTFQPVPVLTDSKGRKYIDLPTQILNLRYDAGIRYITYNFETCCCGGDPLSQVVFDRTTPDALRNLYAEPYTTPNPKNPFFYRIADKVNGVSVNRLYLLGIECVDVTDVEIGILSTMNPSDLCNLDDELPLSDELIYTLISEVLKLGRFVMMVPEERVNEGSDSGEGIVPKTPVAAPNVAPQEEEEY
jgi:hypothetical protein